MSRSDAILTVLANSSKWLEPGEIDHLTTRTDREDWVRDELIKLVDVELVKLAEARARIDPEVVELDRLGAADRALFDPGPEAILARKYEAAATRGFFRALRDFRQNEAKPASQAAEAEPRSVETESTTRQNEASFGPTGPAQPVAPVVESPSEPGKIQNEPNPPRVDDVATPRIRQNEPNLPRPGVAWHPKPEPRRGF